MLGVVCAPSLFLPFNMVIFPSLPICNFSLPNGPKLIQTANTHHYADRIWYNRYHRMPPLTPIHELPLRVTET